MAYLTGADLVKNFPDRILPLIRKLKNCESFNKLNRNKIILRDDLIFTGRKTKNGDYNRHELKSGKNIIVYDGNDNNHKHFKIKGKLSEYLEYLVKYNKVDEVKTFLNIIHFSNRKGKPVHRTQLLKDEEFGSNRGSGAGSKQTENQESAFCLLGAYYLANNYSFNNKESFNLEEIKKVGDYYDIGNSDVLSTIEFVNTNKEWRKITKESVEAFFKESNVGKLKGKFHRQSGYVKKIYDRFRILLNEKIKLLDLDVNVRINNDKWNPADVWFITEKDFNISSFGESIEEYNNVFNEHKLFPISLKKTNNPKCEKIEPKENDGIEKLNKVEIVKQDDIFSSKDLYVKVYNKNPDDGLTLQLRNFNKEGIIQSELKNKGIYEKSGANHGKCGLGIMEFIAKKFIGKWDKISSIEKLIKMDDADVIERLRVLYKNIFNKENKDITLENFHKIHEDNRKEYIISKLQAMEFVSKVKGNRDVFVSIAEYAKSEGGLKGIFKPAPHWKIS